MGAKAKDADACHVRLHHIIDHVQVGSLHADTLSVEDPLRPEEWRTQSQCNLLENCGQWL